MAKIDDILKEFPEPVQETLRPIWERLSEDKRKDLEDLLKLLPGSVRPIKDVIQLVLDQYKPLVDTKHKIAIVGPANVGKSTLYNQLITETEDEAEVGPIPGTTRQNQEGDGGLFTMVDTPGADAVGEVGERERQIAFDAASQADFLIIVFEASLGIKRAEKELFDSLVAMEKPYIVVLNKMDLVPQRNRQAVIDAAARNLRLNTNQIIDTVATEGKNVGRLIMAVAKFEPGLLALLAEAMPEYRHRLAWQRIIPAASSAGIVGLIPLPFFDLIPLLGIQTGLVLSIARIYGYDLTASRAKELIATFGIGFAARTVFQELSKLGGLPGWILSAAIAASTTVAMGYAAMMWFAYGEKPTQTVLKRLVSDITTFVKDRLTELGQNRPKGKELREQLRQILADLPEHLHLSQQDRHQTNGTTPSENE